MTLKKSLAVFGQVFVEIYGQGETPMTITCLRREDHAVDDDAVLGSVGWARTGVEVAIVDSRGKPVAPGDIGERQKEDGRQAAQSFFRQA